MPNPTTPTLILFVMISSFASVKILELINIESNCFDFSHFL